MNMKRKMLVGMVALAAVFVVPVPLAQAELATTSDVLADLNAASGAMVHTVIVKNFLFTPQDTAMVNGDTVDWVWDDSLAAGGANRSHTVRSSGSTGDAAQDLNKPVPNAPGRCFNSEVDQGIVLNGNLGNSVYSQSDITWKGIVSNGDTPCPGDSSIQVGGSAGVNGVVPYHCRIHGTVQAAGAGMRGTLSISLT